MKRKTLVSWSSGKDCAWALHCLRSDPTIEVVGLFSIITAGTERIAMHTTRLELVRLQADAIGLPLHLAYLPEHPCSNETYEAVMAQAIQGFIAQGIECIAFGDLFLEDIRAYRESKMHGTGIKALFPLWAMPTQALAQVMLDSGIETYISSVDLSALPRSYAGRRVTADLLDSLPDGIDHCGENGETHTIVVDGPMFQQRVPVEIGAITAANGYAYADIQVQQND